MVKFSDERAELGEAQEIPVKGSGRLRGHPLGEIHNLEFGADWGHEMPFHRITYQPVGIQLNGPDASAQAVRRTARLSRNVRQPNHVLVH